MNPLRVSAAPSFYEELTTDPQYSQLPFGYLRYLRQRENDERKEALKVTLPALIEELRTWSLDKRYSFISTLWHASKKFLRKTGTHSSYQYAGIPVPMHEPLVIPTLLEQSRVHPSDPMPHVMLAKLLPLGGLPSLEQSRVLPGDPVLHVMHAKSLHHMGGLGLHPEDRYRIALELANDNPVVIGEYLAWLLDRIRWSCHHLPDALISDAEFVLDNLQRAESHATKLDLSEREPFLKEISDYREQVLRYVSQRRPDQAH